MKATRREFLNLSGSLLLAPAAPSWASTPEQPSLRVWENAEAPWREPGQVKDSEYLRTGKLRYSAEGREIVGYNRSCFNNRPLYCEPPNDCVVLAGDRPFLRLLAEPYVLGSFSAAILRDGSGTWFHEYSEIESRYRCGRMTWHIMSKSQRDLSVSLTAVPLHGAGGFVLRLHAQGLRPGDRLVWAFGGATEDKDVRLGWDPIMRGNPQLYRSGDPRKPQANLSMDPSKCRANQAIIEGQTFRLTAKEAATHVAIGRCDREGHLRLGDASAYSSPAGLLESSANQLPVICGVIDLRPETDDLYWMVEAGSTDHASKNQRNANAAEAFRESTDYLAAIERVEIETPEPRLDAAIASVCHPIDAACDRNPYIYRHGCMAFFIQFLGWRVLCGATALGWHDRILSETQHYAAFQVKDSAGRQNPQSDPNREYCIEGAQSRFWGRGRLAPNDEHMYNTQSQFFDQAIRDWRWTADAKLEETLLPMLELHLEWARDCFDPDDDGLYETYINSLPTDSVWYNGGGSVEESAYVYYAHRAAADMARRAGDTASTTRHSEQAQKIQLALNKILWLKERGHFGLYQEQGGHQRVHSDAWVYSEFLPIDAGITTSEQALQSLYYTEWALERVRLPFGGVLCQPSNWVPWKWSVRDTFGGDVCALALAYFQTGLADEGWELLLGATLESAYGGAVPGGMSHIGAGTDFSDNCHMFARTVVEGLFGFEPDYPNNLVRFRPAFPSAWEKASIRTPDYSLTYQQEGNIDRYDLTLTRPSHTECLLPVRAEKVLAVTWNGEEIAWTAEPGFGCTLLRIRAKDMASARLAIQLSERIPLASAIRIEGEAGTHVQLTAPRGILGRWQDFHGVLERAQSEGSSIHGQLASKPGFHIVLADVLVGSLPQRQIFKINVRAPAMEAKLASQTLQTVPANARWTLIDSSPHCNGDIRTIFQQSYLSPRPKTCSVRLGADGYSAWTFPFWKVKPPIVDLDHLDRLSDSAERIVTPQSVPFRRPMGVKNIAFTSLWDNWPSSITVSVSSKAEALWLLVCGSTFPMQTRIANAVLRFRYADSVIETLELVPPLNFWSLCSWGQGDYDYALDGFCLPHSPPPTVNLGNNCRAMVLSWKLRGESQLEDVTLETLSQDVVIGLMGLSLMNPAN